MKTYNRGSGWLSNQTKSYPPAHNYLETRNCVLASLSFLTQTPTKFQETRKIGVALPRVPAGKANVLANKQDRRFNAF